MSEKSKNNQVGVCNEREKTIREVIEFRFNQPDYSRLAEYITGLRPGNSEMLDRLTYDQQKVRYKYGLPPMNWILENPTEYERFLRNIAKKNKTHIRYMSDCGVLLFSKASHIAAVYFYKRKDIGIDIDKTDKDAYLMSLAILEHEIIHSIQDTKFFLPIEIVEYEAYVAGLNSEYFEDNSDEIGWRFFEDNVAVSVNYVYAKNNEKRSEKGLDLIEPEWKDPEFFLKNVDGIDSKEIEKYKR